jgi:hypothetical protein
MAKQFILFGRSSSLLLLIFYNFLLALTEMLAGSLCLLITFFAKHIGLVDTIISAANTSDYLDRFVVWLLEHLVALHLDYQLLLNVGLVLIGLGVFKVFVAIGLWFKSHKMRVVALVIFGSLSLYSIYQLIISFSFFGVFALLLDLYIVYYFWRVLPKHLED